MSARDTLIATVRCDNTGASGRCREEFRAVVNGMPGGDQQDAARGVPDGWLVNWQTGAAYCRKHRRSEA